MKKTLNFIILFNVKRARNSKSLFLSVLADFAMRLKIFMKYQTLEAMKKP